MQTNRLSFSLLVVAALMFHSCQGCIEQQEPSATGGSGAGPAKVIIDGSSTVEPISKAVMESFAEDHPDVLVTVGRSGTSAGFEKFELGETDISNASREIKPAEVEACQNAGIDYVELAIAIDGMSVVVHPSNDWCTSLTVEQLKSIWEEGSQVDSWDDIDPSWPSDPISLWGPDDASGTYDYFIEAVIGKEGTIRNDYHPSENDNELVEGVAGTPGALGFFGYAFYVQNEDEVKAIGIAEGDREPVLPTPETIEDGSYSPLSRRLYIYVNTESLETQAVRDFVEFYLSDEGIAHVPEVGYVSLPAEELDASRARLQEALGE